MTAIVLFVFGSIGLTHIIVDSAIFAPIRSWLQKILPVFVYKIFECYQCAGQYTGWFLGGLLFGIPLLIAEKPDYYAAVVYTFVAGFASSFLSYVSAAMLTYFEANSIVPTNEV